MISPWRKHLKCTLHGAFAGLRLTTCNILLMATLLPWLLVRGTILDESGQTDILTPYTLQHGPLNRRHRDTQMCQSVRFRNVTHSKYPASFHPTPVTPLVESHYMLKEVGASSWNKREVYVTHQVVYNPMTTWSVLEPGHFGTCLNGSALKATVKESAQQKNCTVATNAGFFNTHTGACLGNIVSGGFLVQDFGGIQNVHFGVTKDRHIYTGYLSKLDLLYQDFLQLVGGVVWLVRDGHSYVEESKSIECPDTEETGTVDRFINVISARTAVGHDADGRIHMVQVNGKTDVMGVNLHEFADLLIELGLLNAINLDGGGSTSLVINGTLANYPSDHCVNSRYGCPREVSTILCVHEPACASADCSGHGTCDLGLCHCQGYWTGTACDKLECPESCNGHGLCTSEGCRCYAGWTSQNCSLSCQDGWYGENCLLPCDCENGATCDSASGICMCLPGFTGKYCRSVCPAGFFGQDCDEICFCENSCYCDHVTGDCNATVQDSELIRVSKCLAQKEIMTHHLVPDKGQEYSLCISSVICLSVIALVSLLLNVALTYLLVKSRQGHHREVKRQTRLAVKHALRALASRSNNSESDDEDEEDIFDARYVKRRPREMILKDSAYTFMGISQVEEGGNKTAEWKKKKKEAEMGEKEKEEEEANSSAQEEDSLLVPKMKKEMST